MINHLKQLHLRKVVLIIAIIILLFAFFYSKKALFQNYIDNLKRPQDRQIIEKSMVLQGDWYIKNQMPDGSFVYQRNVANGKANIDDSNHEAYIARQAMTLYSLALFYKQNHDPKIEESLKKGYEYFKKNSVETGPDPKKITKNLTIAYKKTQSDLAASILLLSLIEYMEANKNNGQEYYQFAEKLADNIQSTKTPEGGFVVSNPNTQSYYDGEAFYALTRMAQFSKDKKYLESEQKTADFLITTYMNKPFSTEFYGWGMKGFYYLYQIDPQEKYWIFMKDYTTMYFRGEGKLYDDFYRNNGSIAPTLSLAGHLEGLIHVAKIAETKDKPYYLKVRKFIETSLNYLSTLQIEGPRSNKKTYFNSLKGGMCLDFQCRSLRIDITGHMLSAEYFYLTLLNK